jgi:osmotically inducible protein OsmC
MIMPAISSSPTDTSSPGTPGNGTTPEQLFAAGWSACFEGAMGLAARKMRITLPADLAIDAEVDQTCPYSKAIRGNVDVVINLV